MHIMQLLAPDRTPVDLESAQQVYRGFLHRLNDVTEKDELPLRSAMAALGLTERDVNDDCSALEGDAMIQAQGAREKEGQELLKKWSERQKEYSRTKHLPGDFHNVERDEPVEPQTMGMGQQIANSIMTARGIIDNARTAPERMRVHRAEHKRPWIFNGQR